MDWLGLSFRLLVLVVMLVGLFGLVVPIFPGIVVIWGAALVYGLVQGFGSLGGWIFAGLTVLMLLGVTVDNIAMGAGARKGGATWWSIALAMIAALAGTYFFPPAGGLVLAPLALLVAEYLHQRDLHQAWEAAKGYLIGCGWAFVARFSLGVIMIGLWAYWAWRG